MGAARSAGCQLGYSGLEVSRAAIFELIGQRGSVGRWHTPAGLHLGLGQLIDIVIISA
jgi:hypothetical protein